MTIKPRTVRAVLWALIAVAVVVLVLVRYRRTALVERLSGSQAGRPSQYLARTPLGGPGAGDEIIVDYQPPDGGKLHTVAQAPMPHGFRMILIGMNVPFLKVGSKGSVFVTLSNQPLLTSSGLKNSAVSKTAPLPTHAVGAKRITTFTEAPSKYLDGLFHLDLASQTLEPLVERAQLGGFAVVGKEAYWIDPRTEIVKQIPDVKDSHNRFVRKPASLLKVTDLVSHTTRTVCNGMDNSDDLRISSGMIYWQRLEAYSDANEQTMGLWAYVPGCPAPVHLCDQSGSQQPGENTPVLSGGRIVWLDFTPDASDLAVLKRNGRMDVASMQPDGAGKRVDLSFRVAHGLPYLSGLQEDAGRLYCTWTGRPGGPGTDVQQYICLLQPGAPQPLRHLFSLPGASAPRGIRDGYIYYESVGTDMEGMAVKEYYRRRLR